MIRQSARTGRTLSTSSIQREVIQAQGHSGSNQNCTLSFASGCSVTPAQNSHSGKGIPTGTVRIGAEAFGFRKVIDATFMIGFLVTGRDVGKADVDKYLAALRRAQMEIDLHPELYKHHHLRAVPEKYREQVDVRAFGTGERIVFLPLHQGGLCRDPG